MKKHNTLGVVVALTIVVALVISMQLYAQPPDCDELVDLCENTCNGEVVYQWGSVECIDASWPCSPNWGPVDCI